MQPVLLSGIFSEEMKDYLGLGQKDRDKFVTDGGHSSIVGPQGEFLARAEAGECIIYAEADLEKIVEGKMKHDLSGHYNRFDIFNLKVNREPLPPITFSDPV